MGECGIAVELMTCGRCGEISCELPAQGTAPYILGAYGRVNVGVSLSLSADLKMVM